jgi:hypothetical protein
MLQKLWSAWGKWRANRRQYKVDRAQVDQGPAPWLRKAGYLPLAALIAIVIYSLGDWDIFAAAILLAGGATVAGGLLGFLFGIPRALAGPEHRNDADTPPGYVANTNLEQISDWLTKILVGVGLVQFTTLARHIGDLIDVLGPALGGDPRGRAFAGATIAVFSISGFLAFYLVTRLYLPGAFAQADAVLKFNRALARLEHHGPNPPTRVRELIEADLKAAEKSPYLRSAIEANDDIKAFRNPAPPNP